MRREEKRREEKKTGFTGLTGLGEGGSGVLSDLVIL
jgi:hypothetical protein